MVAPSYLMSGEEGSLQTAKEKRSVQSPSSKWGAQACCGSGHPGTAEGLPFAAGPRAGGWLALVGGTQVCVFGHRSRLFGCAWVKSRRWTGRLSSSAFPRSHVLSSFLRLSQSAFPCRATLLMVVPSCGFIGKSAHML